MEEKQELLLAKLWKNELQILDEFARVCKNNNLKYSLTYGTLIGAIRHKGFIPWDDDIDVMMPRHDYERLLEIWDQVADKNYILQNKTRETDFTQNFSKIRKKGTKFIQSEEEYNAKYNTGMFIDIFPLDRAAPNRPGRCLQIVATAVNLLLAKDFHSGKKGVYYWIEAAILKFPDSIKRKLYIETENIIAKYEGRNDLPLFSSCTIANASILYPKGTFDNLIDLQFENKKYLCTALYDDFLKQDYGDYMRLPPEEDRVLKHRPIEIADNEQ